MGDSATGESLPVASRLSLSSSSGVGSSGSTVSKDVCDEKESRMFVDALEVARDTLLEDLFGLVL